MALAWWIPVFLAGAWALAYFRAPLWLWTATIAAALAAVTYTQPLATFTLILLWVVFFAVAIPLNFPPLRRVLISNHVLRIFRGIMPAMSDTEREALEAGTVWWEAEVFSGKPDWKRLRDFPAPSLSEQERAFLDGTVEELCRLIDDWEITHERRDLPPEVWRFLKEKGFFGMIIPKRYGGLEFSAQAHSAVVTKIATRSLTVAVTVMVPNSLGPAELLLRYGTDEQKNRYLPRLARGEEVPCFALTSPEAGSDAASMPDRAIVCKGEFGGRKDVLGMRVTWEKRYITLGPVATLLGLAFRLFDPDHLLGEEEDLGITLALIPTDTPGVNIGRRHNPLDIPFQNGPNSGKDVFIPMDYVIGGQARVGQGWRMLMDCLAAGRSISLPALSTGAGKLASRATGAYARIRKQFKLPIGRFEGVEEALARIGGYAYMMDAARSFTARALDEGEQPAVASAIVKYHLTEHMRRVVNDAMDIQGGSAICLGPQNLLGRGYQALPISITVEGANILTRTLIIYGQGAVRCHPYVRAEMEAVADRDRARAQKTFDRAFFGHMGFTLSNALRAFWLGITGARLVRVPFAAPTRRYAQQLTRLSSAFAFVSDVAMLTLGGALKRKEKISGRLADVLSFLYLASAVIKRFEDDGRPGADVPLVRYACEYCLHQAEKSLVVVLKNFPSRFVDWLCGGLVFPSGRHFHPPNDRLGHQVAAILLSPSATRDRLTDGIFIPRDPTEQLGRMEVALHAVILAEPHERKLREAVDRNPLLHGDVEAQIAAAVASGALTAAEGDLVRRAHELRCAVIRVDDFPPDEI
jgi:acyl-CoA dehydrogenase